MENITLGQLASFITIIASAITGFTFLMQNMKKWIKVAMKETTDSIDKRIDILEAKIDSVSSRIDVVDMESVKNYLVTTLSDIDRGKTLDAIEQERFWEEYSHYEKIGGNSYIKRKTEELKDKNWL